MLILAGVTINLTVGETGIFTRAKQAKEDYLVAVNTEQELLANAEKALGSSTIGGSTGEDTEEPSVTTKMKIGDYVDYEPTKADVDKTVSVDASKLIYVSPVGGYSSTEKMVTNGNGYSVQTFTAKANDGTENGVKWRVVNIYDNKIDLISEKSIPTNSGDGYTMKGGIAYLYAEQEIHSACAIYGYGYGADTSIETNYTVGGPTDTPINKKIVGSGAKSISIQYLLDLATLPNDNYTGSDGFYGISTYPYMDIYYPTLFSTDNSEISKSTNMINGIKNTNMRIAQSPTLFPDTVLSRMIYSVKNPSSQPYWLATQTVYTSYYEVRFWTFSGISK